ncbi:MULTISPECIES: hypothetical protein [Giesbergeria]|uniref:Uncharacterized protein n=1 Tax=Giesbergeria sinuosa TaxID=80883 RepID=A0ABV9QDH4_9BURK
MRTVFTIVALVLALAVVGLLARQQLSASRASLPSAPGVAPGAAGQPLPPTQQVQQYRQAVEAQMQQPRPLPADAQ